MSTVPDARVPSAPAEADPVELRFRGLAHLRWVAIVVPLAALAAFELLSHQLGADRFARFPDAAVLFAPLALGVVGFAVAIFKAIERLDRRVVQQNAQLSALNRIAAASAERLELPDLLDVALDQAISAMHVDGGVICLLDTDTDELVASCSRGLSDEILRRIARQPVDDDPVGRQVVRTGCPVTVERLLDDPAYAAIVGPAGLRSSVSVPLKSEGRVSGVLALVSRRERRFTAAETALLSSIGSQLGLAVRNAILFARARQRNEELSALLAVGRAAASSLDLSAMLDQALDATLSATSAEAAEVWLIDEAGDLVLERRRGDIPAHMTEPTRLSSTDGLAGLALSAGEPVVVHDLGSDPRCVRPELHRLGFATMCALPLRPAGETVGVITVLARRADALHRAAEVRLFQGIGEQVGIAVENARLHAQVLDVAVLEERERISRDLHDGLGQILGYINTQAMAIRRLLASGRVEVAEREVLAIEQAAKELYTDVREAILGLRTSLAHPGELVSSLRAYLERYQDTTGVTVHLDLGEGVEALHLPASVEIQLMRIIQEALSNVRKHARAADARISLDVDAGNLVLGVADGGRGFAPGRSPSIGRPRFGLQTMRERAEAVGGRFEVVSRPGGGTTVVVRVGVAGHAEVV